MAYHFIATVRDSSKYPFRLFAGRKAKFVSFVGETSLDTATHPYSKMYEASYYLNIIANESSSDWSNVVSKLKAYAKELNPNMMEYDEYQKDNEKTFRELFKDHPQYDG
tara:strand:- start:227 stop:553 length:327 start_codon:yes stop_codon:yes gene_type:complete